MSKIHIRYRDALVVLGVLCAGSLALPAQGASFDCAKASTKVEHMICENPDISRLDEEMSAKFKLAEQETFGREALVQSQRQWLSERNACSDAICVKDAYRKRLSALAAAQQSENSIQSPRASSEFATPMTNGRKNTVSEQDKVRDIMMSHHFSVRLASPKSSEASCKAFLDDFRVMKDITFLQPLIESNDYGDKRWDAYKARCPSTDLFEAFTCDPKTQEYVDSLPETAKHAEEMNSCQLFRCTQRFRLFKVAANGDNEAVFDAFYCEHMRGPLNWGSTKQEASGGYLLTNPKDCNLNSWVPTDDPYSYGFHRTLENHNGIIMYHGRYYVFDLSEPDGSDRVPMKNYVLHIWGRRGPQSKASITESPTMTPICMFSTISDTTSE